MKEQIINLLLTLVLAGVCGIGAYLLRMNKQNILRYVTELMQKAEEAVKGSGLGAEKKALVLAQLEAAGIKVKAWMSKAIDDIVKELNAKNGWYCEQAKNGL